jgi:hypothetical protein
VRGVLEREAGLVGDEDAVCCVVGGLCSWSVR